MGKRRREGSHRADQALVFCAGEFAYRVGRVSRGFPQRSWSRRTGVGCCSSRRSSCRRRLHRRTPRIQQQTPQIRPTLHPLIRPHQRGEHIRGERLKPLPHNGKPRQGSPHHRTTPNHSDDTTTRRPNTALLGRPGGCGGVRSKRGSMIEDISAARGTHPVVRRRAVDAPDSVIEQGNE